ncbi:hypothetical protein BaRGS_00005028 [Batillaria attramentaria]|uniref:Uncharacterized protein n=1 Tax=Batillaria attramentaria TaxID=370345 RepID=A0ABD0LWL8_9CAEN
MSTIQGLDREYHATEVDRNVQATVVDRNRHVHEPRRSALRHVFSVWTSPACLRHLSVKGEVDSTLSGDQYVAHYFHDRPRTPEDVPSCHLPSIFADNWISMVTMTSYADLAGVILFFPLLL